MHDLTSLNVGMWLWLVASIAVLVALVVLVAVLWIRDRRPPRTALGWTVAWVLLHLTPVIGSVCILAMLYVSMRGFIDRCRPTTS